MASKRIYSALTKHAATSTNYLYKYTPEALVSPSEGISWSYKDLLSQVTNTSKGLIDQGFGPNTSIAASLPNVSSNVTLQLACALTGTTLVTTKDPASLDEAAKKFGCRDVLVLGDVEAKLTNAGAKNRSVRDICISTDQEEFAFYGAGAKETTLSSLLVCSDTTSSHFSMVPADVVACPVALNHTMGMGFGVLPALLSGASVVLPSPTPDPTLLMDALRDQLVTLLVADTHLTVKMNEMRGGEIFQSLRGGLVKVGSGEAIVTTVGMEVAGCQFDTVGVAKKK